VIHRWYEITCDYCGCASHYMGNKRSAESLARDEGYIITRDGKHYCDSKCRCKAKEAKYECKGFK
jgi:hypothetical protein